YSCATAYTASLALSLHDALPISEDLAELVLDGFVVPLPHGQFVLDVGCAALVFPGTVEGIGVGGVGRRVLRKQLLGLQEHGLGRSEEHTSELQSRFDLVCRLLLE